MGRPLYKDINGVDARSSYTTTAIGIRAKAYFSGSLRDDVIIINQKGARKYRVQDVSDSSYGVCKLVSGTPAANGEMQIIGLVDGKGASQVAINKLQKRTAIDWSGNRYKWSMANDSSNDAIILTAI